MNRFVTILLVLIGALTCSQVGAYEQLADGLFQGEIDRDETPIYFYHQQLTTEDQVRFWKRFAGGTLRSSGMQAVYGVILEQDNADCPMLYSDKLFRWMETEGVENAEETIFQARAYLEDHQITRKQLERVLAGHRAGVASFNPFVGGHVVFATRNPIDHPYELKAGANPEAASFRNVLLVFSSWETELGGVAHRGTIRNIHDLVRPDPLYKNISVLAHGFAAQIERDVYQRLFLEATSDAFMSYLLIRTLPHSYLHDEAQAYFFNSLSERPDARDEILAEALDLAKNLPPLDFEGLENINLELDRIVFDLGLLARRFAQVAK